MEYYARWEFMARVMEKRELTSKNNASWRGYLVTVATMGKKFELDCTDQDYAHLVVGHDYLLQGVFDEFNGRDKYKLTEITDAELVSDRAA